MIFYGFSIRTSCPRSNRSKSDLWEKRKHAGTTEGRCVNTICFHKTRIWRTMDSGCGTKKERSERTLTLSAWGPSVDVRFWRIKTIPALKAYITEDIYDYFKLSKPFSLQGLNKNNSALQGLRHTILYRIKPEELYILSCGKGRGRRPRPFSQVIM